MKKYYLMNLAAILILSSCTTNTKSHFEVVNLNNKSNIGYISHNAMLENSLEKVTLSSEMPESVEKIMEWIAHEKPTYVKVSCNSSNTKCANIEKSLISYSIPIKRTPYNENEVNDITLVYQKLISRDCYNDMSALLTSSNIVVHPPLGCSVTQNILEMVSDHTQFINPKLSGLQDAHRAIKAIKNN